MGLLAACVYGADTALPLHDTYTHPHILNYAARELSLSYTISLKQLRLYFCCYFW